MTDPSPATSAPSGLTKKLDLTKRVWWKHPTAQHFSWSVTMNHFSPREIVSELDRFIVGQGDAKRAVAIALRNRWRRLQLDERLREEVLPKNILMIGPTGVAKPKFPPPRQARRRAVS